MPGIATPGYLVMPDELGSPCESAGEDESQQVSKDHGPTRPSWTQIGTMVIPPLPSIADRRPAFDPHGKQRPGGRERRPAFDPPSQPLGPLTAVVRHHRPRPGGEGAATAASIGTRGTSAAAAPPRLCQATEPAAAGEGERGGGLLWVAGGVSPVRRVRRRTGVGGRGGQVRSLYICYFLNIKQIKLIKF
jgi:hypothetical protein